MAELHILCPRGFSAAGVACGIKSAPGAFDLALLVADAPATVAGVFTKNKVVAAPVVLDRRVVRKGRARLIVINAGNANACTGRQGMADAREMARLAAKAVGAKSSEALVSSTGVIGHFLPMDKVRAGIAAAAAQLSKNHQAACDFSRAIMTTDLVPKMTGREGKVGGRDVTIAGACKGSGMIAPNMATMLAYVTTDAHIGPKALGAALRIAADASFNAITVDGHSSTNDSLVAMASGAAGGDEITEESPAFDSFTRLLTGLCQDLALRIVADGEGATRVVEVRVEGAASIKDARAAARAIAESPLVKCAVNGGDPNWGRVVSAVGYSGARMVEGKLRHWIGDELVFAGGMPTDFDRPKCERLMNGKRVLLRVDLGVGNSKYICWTCDFSKEYVTINADYHT